MAFPRPFLWREGHCSAGSLFGATLAATTPFQHWRPLNERVKWQDAWLLSCEPRITRSGLTCMACSCSSPPWSRTYTCSMPSFSATSAIACESLGFRVCAGCF
eukprot:364944-Chlamydomonas_euryale.AAC.8